MIVDDVVPGGPAESAGLMVQDIVLTADDRPIETMSALTAATYLHNPDRLLKLEILRGTAKNAEKKVLYVPAVEKHDQIDLLMDATDPEKSLVPRLGVLAVDITGLAFSEWIMSSVAGHSRTRSASVRGRHAARSGRGGGRRPCSRSDRLIR